MKSEASISVCIPAYNRANVLPALLDSIFSQDFNNFQVVVSEDASPERLEIRKIAEDYSARYPGKLIYAENKNNLGYDKNIRRLVELAQFEYVMFMGNDDLMCQGALRTVSDALLCHPNIGVVLRSYAAFDGAADNIVQTFRYFDRKIFFPAGAETIGTVYRRSVVIPGMVFHRNAALSCATDVYDGTLLYQLYLVASILIDMNAIYVPDVIVLYRNGGTPDFGSSEVEKGVFQPKEQTPSSSLFFVKGMLDIARSIEDGRGVKIYSRICRDLGNYSYPLIAIQAGQPLSIFLRYSYGLARLGLGKYILFWIYLFGILILGTRNIDKVICRIKLRLGYTPALGKIYQGVFK